MSYFYTQLVRKFAYLVCFTFLSYTSFSQAGWTALITVTNLVQTDANTFEYEVYITNNGPVNYAIAGYSWGMNMTPGIANGGTLQHTYLCRDAIFNPIPAVTAGYTASTSHLRATTTNVGAGSEVSLIPAYLIN